MPLTQKQFDLVATPPDWSPAEIPVSQWLCLPRVVRPYDTVAVMGSGCESTPRYINGIFAVAGADVLVLERNPKTDEPEGNAYHYVFQRSGHHRYPYIMCGLFRSETRVPHWFSAEDLHVYWGDVGEKPNRAVPADAARRPRR
jgi:hypothetical protein